MMKATNIFGKLLLLFALIFLLDSCQKIIEYFPDGKPHKNYRLKKITFRTEFDEYEGKFYYNKWGNPDSIIFGFVATGHPNIYLYYNNKKQLKEMRGLYVSQDYEDWHRYGYTGNRITSDTTYNWGDASRDPEPNNYHDKRINYFEYDSYGRIIKETWDFIYPDFPSMEFNFQYGEDGNLIKPLQGLQYDNYTNIHQLHPIWQFLARDYSINNPFPASSYNNGRLPLRFNQPIAYPLRYNFINGARYMEQASIEYETK